MRLHGAALLVRDLYTMLGKVTMSICRRLVSSCVCVQALQPGEAEREAAACIEKMDKDRDGAISFEEFIEVADI